MGNRIEQGPEPEPRSAERGRKLNPSIDQLVPEGLPELDRVIAKLGVVLEDRDLGRLAGSLLINLVVTPMVERGELSTEQAKGLLGIRSEALDLTPEQREDAHRRAALKKDESPFSGGRPW